MFQQLSFKDSIVSILFVFVLSKISQLLTVMSAEDFKLNDIVS